MPTDEPKRVLILGGTGLAREAADVLVELGINAVSSLAGVTHSPHLPRGEVRTGGFGGEDGLVAYLEHVQFDCVVDATHPFAAQISSHAAEACARTKIKILRLEPEPWAAQPGDQWTWVASASEAAGMLPQGARVALTIGRKEIGPFLARQDLAGLARMIEPPEWSPSAAWQLLLERPPFTVDAEIDLLQSSGAQWLVSKNAGGRRAAKLDAARALSLPVLMVKRPPKPQVLTVNNVQDLVAALGLAVRPAP
jgi:precorrin-6A/cobalt-precorrin-6A reductase